MKILKQMAAVAVVALSALGIARAARVVYSQNLVNETALTYNNTYTLDMGNSLLSRSNVDSLSMQAVYSSATISAVTFTDGVKSTATVTISSYTALHGTQATNTLTVKSTQTIVNLGVSFKLNAIPFAYGDLWSVGASSAATAVNICTAINTYGPTMNLFSCSTTSAGVATITVISSGVAGNLYALTSSSAAALQAGAATFSGGANKAILVINGTALTEGTDFNAVTSSAITAGNIVTAIKGNSVLNAILTVSTPTAGVVSATAAAVGYNTNYGVFTSTPAAMSVSNNGFFGGTDSLVASSVITKANHNFTTGLAVLLTKTAGTEPQNLAAGTTYYVIRVDASNFKLASSLTNAKAGTNLVVSTVTGSGSFVLTPLTIAGTPSFKWQYSNDNANWSDVAVSSVTMSSLAPATTTWDFGTFNYRYIRLNVVAPTAGGINLVVTGVGKSSY